jgi:hypothetical protein
VSGAPVTDSGEHGRVHHQGFLHTVEAVMRMLLKAVMDTDAANEVALKGQLKDITHQLVDQLHAEAAYFVSENGQRSCLVVFDMTDSAQIPAIAEPLFLGAKAQVTFSPCMNLEDLDRGLSQLAADHR